LGYTDLAQDTDIILLIRFIAAFLTLLHFHLDSPPFLFTHCQNFFKNHS
jgi:hypothetical protein